MKLADRGAAPRAVRHAIDHEAAHAADTFAAIAVEGDGIFAFQSQLFIHHVQHFQKRHFRIHITGLILHHTARLVHAFLPPDVKRDAHGYL